MEHFGSNVRRTQGRCCADASETPVPPSAIGIVQGPLFSNNGALARSLVCHTAAIFLWTAVNRSRMGQKMSISQKERCQCRTRMDFEVRQSGGTSPAPTGPLSAVLPHAGTGRRRRELGRVVSGPAQVTGCCRIRFLCEERVHFGDESRLFWTILSARRTERVEMSFNQTCCEPLSFLFGLTVLMTCCTMNRGELDVGSPLQSAPLRRLVLCAEHECPGSDVNETDEMKEIRSVISCSLPYL